MDLLLSFYYLFDTVVVVIEPNTLEIAGLFPVNGADMGFVAKFPNAGAPLWAVVAAGTPPNDSPIAGALWINGNYGLERI